MQLRSIEVKDFRKLSHAAVRDLKEVALSLREKVFGSLERAKGFEPSTPTLASGKSKCLCNRRE